MIGPGEGKAIFFGKSSGPIILYNILLIAISVIAFSIVDILLPSIL